MVVKVDKKLQEKREQKEREVVQAIEYGLDEAVRVSGGVLTGLSVKISDVDVLLTLRALHEGKPMVSHVGCPDMSSCLRKAVVEGFNGGLRWKADRFVSNGG